MTHNPTSPEYTMTTENQGGKLQEITAYSNKEIVDLQRKPPKAAVSLEKSDRDEVRLEAPQPGACMETDPQADLENEKDLSDEFNFYKEKLNFMHSQQRKDLLRESLPRYGLSEKSTQTLLTARDLEDLEALRAGPPKDLMLSLIKSSPDLIKKIYGVNLNSVFASPAAISYFNNFHNFENDFATENSKNFTLNAKSLQADNAGKLRGPGRKALALTKKAQKNLLLHSQLQQDENLQKMQMMISRKRKIPVDYSELNKNGVHDKSMQLELKQLKGKEKDLHAKSFNVSDEEAKNFFASFADANFGDFSSAAANSHYFINNNFNHNNNLINNLSTSGFMNNYTEKVSSSNKIFIKRKVDSKRKNKFKNTHVPHLHFSHKLIPIALKVEKSEGKLGPGRNGSAKNKKVNKNLKEINENKITENNANDSNISLSFNSSNNINNNNILNNNLIFPTEENENSLLQKNASSKNNKFSKQNQIKSLNLNESEEPSSSRERGRPSKKNLLAESLLSSKKNSSSNLMEKLRAGNAASGNDNFFSSVNEDFSKSSYDASQAKLNENEDLNEISNPLVIKEFSNEVEILNETERKFGRGRGGKHGPGRAKKAFYDRKKDQAINSANELNKNDSFIKMSEETNVSNFDTHSEIKRLNFSVTHKPAAKPVVEKISKKFDPYLYFRNECIQSHPNNNRSEEEIEKECQIGWKNLGKDLKAVYFHMAEQEKKIFKKIRKLNSLSLKEKAEN